MLLKTFGYIGYYGRCALETVKSATERSVFFFSGSGFESRVRTFLVRVEKERESEPTFREITFPQAYYLPLLDKSEEVFNIPQPHFRFVFDCFVFVDTSKRKCSDVTINTVKHFLLQTYL